ncbi:YheV family putative metal-binding protein [Yersinia kristensenii]|uniref:YheV family putative zinc ribbon protein n=1 Tax=Yersinia kristensenii TaxID=28152 RepID=UPI00051950FA|nr:YheV family putative zinc ribbon protein [Yersinia kristensenii]MBW5812189.1 YheV family putative metal-binding protein [Yersinia kristensenii]MBW5815442.1 YheV family putative metal-binding protein [Yersinia kristensenii]MBW5824616.1 YheV family putative metal-binding protein [Yersinia kristensenii]MBW5829243.1 YheV family putative metal-binding protein [Yersinia kristensenii]MBW5841351.1 YheV family putative metal-binding protein [Yersinia kristensenii]
MTITPNNKTATRKRFIAGAVCPQCKALDTLALWREDQVEVVECVKCGHHQRQTDEQVNQHVRENEQVIGIFDPQ